MKKYNTISDVVVDLELPEPVNLKDITVHNILWIDGRYDYKYLLSYKNKDIGIIYRCKSIDRDYYYLKKLERWRNQY